MSDQVDLFKVLQIIAWGVAAVAGVLLAPLKWIVQRAVARLELHASRLNTLERTSVTRQDFNDALEKLRKEAKEDRAILHSENVQHLDRIECKIDENEERNNDLRTTVYNMSSQVAVLADRSNRKP